MKTLTLQCFIANQWQDIAILQFDDKTYQLCNLSYLSNYVAQHFGDVGSQAISINYPIDFFIDSNYTDLLSVLNDVMPAGASRRY